jgi:hypothetical protein
VITSDFIMPLSRWQVDSQTASAQTIDDLKLKVSNTKNCCLAQHTQIAHPREPLEVGDSVSTLASLLSPGDFRSSMVLLLFSDACPRKEPVLQAFLASDNITAAATACGVFASLDVFS